MKHLYYLLGLICLVYEMQWIFSPLQFSRQIKAIEDTNDVNDPKSIFHILLQVGLLIYLVLGIFTFQWPLYLAFTIVSMVFIQPVVAQLKDHERSFAAAHFLNSILGFLFILFTILNSYHLKIDFWGVIQSYF